MVEVISKPEFLEVGHTDFYNHISLIDNIISRAPAKGGAKGGYSPPQPPPPTFLLSEKKKKWRN